MSVPVPMRRRDRAALALFTWQSMRSRKLLRTPYAASVDNLIRSAFHDEVSIEEPLWAILLGIHIGELEVPLAEREELAPVLGRWAKLAFPKKGG